MNKELVIVKREVGEAMARKVNEDLVADSGKTCTDVTGNKVVQEDDETMKVITLSQSAQYCKTKIKNDQIGANEVLSNELTKTLPKID
ncbi:hypothetical protein CASFOL_007196 [Castilleja foliolosa]|uniref:Uncharacterized protein n=1 Tax=Castilleja foliolosa TaxID=1961234 RepID=A0ABD3E8X1_9LAMI